MRIPSDRQIRALHERHAPTRAAFELVYTHCEIVCGIAEQLLARGAPATDTGRDTLRDTVGGLDADLVRAGSLLHDIGVYRLYDAAGELDHARYLRHGLLGHEMLSAEGFPDALCRFCSRHTGMGLTREDVRDQALPLPVADYVAESSEERLVMYADKFHSKTDPPVFVTAPTYAARVRRFGEGKRVAFDALRQTFGEPDLGPFVRAYGYAAL
jgi:uncharacterized protein